MYNTLKQITLVHGVSGKEHRVANTLKEMTQNMLGEDVEFLKSAISSLDTTSDNAEEQADTWVYMTYSINSGSYHPCPYRWSGCRPCSCLGRPCFASSYPSLLHRVSFRRW